MKLVFVAWLNVTLLSDVSPGHDHSGIVSKMYRGTVFSQRCTSQMRKDMNCCDVSFYVVFG